MDNMEPLFFPASCELNNFLIARNVADLFSSNRGVSHFYAARRIDELSRGSLSGYENQQLC